jgi:hypothetical protein
LNLDINTKVLSVVLAVAFVISALVGSYIIATDGYLWVEAPTHAYGLIVFIAIDLAAVVGIFVLPRVTRIVALALPIVQFAAMAGDLYMGLGSPGSVAQGAFRQYLLNDPAYMSLLVLEAMIVGLACGNLLVRPHVVVQAAKVVSGDRVIA